MPEISVVIPVFNRPVELEAAVRSALAQQWTDLEVLVVDDGSSVDLRAACPSIADARVRYLRQANQGPAAARNAGLAAAQGQFVALLDSDDLMLPNNLASLSAQFDRSPRADVVHGWAIFGGPGARDLHTSQPRLRGRAYRELLFENVLSVGAVLLRRGCWVPIGGFDSQLPIFEDWDFWLRLAFHCEFDHVPEVVVRITTQPVRRNTSQPSSQVGETVRAIYAKLLRDPAVKPLIRPFARRLEANAHVMTGHQLRVFDGDYGAARREFWRALRLAPTLARAYLGLLEGLAGPRLVARLRRLRSAVYRQRT